MNHIYVKQNRSKPALVKKKPISNISIINPKVNQKRPIPLSAKPIIIDHNFPPKPKTPTNAAVVKVPSNPKKPKIKYISKEIDVDSFTKINQLRESGKGKVAFIIGNGPSINEVDLARAKNVEKIDIFSINKPDSRIWPTKYWVFFDASQLRRHEDIYNNYQGIVINSTAIKRQKEHGLQVKNLGGKGFSKDMSKGIHIGRSSVFATMQIAMWMNYDRIYIFGCDMNPEGINGKLHFYGENPDVKPEIRKTRFGKEAEYYEYAISLLEESQRKKFVFCSSENKWPFVNQYNKLDHKIAMDVIIASLHSK